jgi:hypothetical protein
MRIPREHHSGGYGEQLDQELGTRKPGSLVHIHN